MDDKLMASLSKKGVDMQECKAVDAELKGHQKTIAGLRRRSQTKPPEVE